ncbi:MAG TPA: diguanylate cyclase [Planctomycetota bacterium]|nr:diguanylate cyclase [Planctomycetota bacterium]
MPLPPYQSRSTIPVLVILLGVAASLFTYSIVRHAEDAAEDVRFGDRAKQAAERLGDEVRHEIDILSRLHDYYRNARPVNDAPLQAFTDSLFSGENRDAALAFVGWAVPLDPVGVAAYERDPERNAPGKPAFRIHGPDGQPVVPSAAQHNDGYRLWVLNQVAPALPGSRLEGLDLAMDDRAHEAIEQALQTGRLAASRPIQLVEPTADSGQEVVLLVLPVFETDQAPATIDARQQTVRGVVVAALAIEPLLRRAFPEEMLNAEQAVSVDVDEYGTDHDRHLLGHVGGQALPDAHTAPPVSLGVANALWTVSMSPAQPMRHTVVDWLDRTSVVLPPAIFVVMCLLSWIVWTQQRQTDVIRVQVQRQTAELRRQNDALEAKELELEEANRKLLQMSNTDALTGILNRRGFEVQLDKERERSRRTSTPFGLLIFDIDHFKDYNDRYGHAAGDEVLRRVAQLMLNEARRIDSVARYGGEEFVILTTGTDAPGLMALGERVRQRIQQAAIENAASPHRLITISGGGALSSAAVGDASQVFDLADRCLYQAKSTGRNRVVMVM